MKYFNFISDRFRQFFSGETGVQKDETDGSPFEGREKIIAFSIALFFAFCLWMIVNLNRDFTVTIQVPIQLSTLSDDLIVSSEVPSSVSVNLSGEGWKLISIYRNPPGITINAESRQVNLPEQIRSQVSAFSDLNILQVEPSQLEIETERKATKRVPVANRVNITFRDQFGLLNEPVIVPDSVTVTGAESALAELNEWETEETELSNISRSVERNIRLKPGSSGISVEPQTVTLIADVTEFTEAEQRVPIRTRNLPSGRAVSYNPSSITIRFDVPIDQYSNIQDRRLFNAYVDYEVIEEDDSGRVAPEVETEETDFIVRVRSFQPPRVSYFRVVSD
jgi:YbbR domain-containing protein